MKNQKLGKDKVLNLQQLEQVSGGRAQDVVSPMDWSTRSVGCGTVGGNEWSTWSEGCKGGEVVVQQ